MPYIFYFIKAVYCHLREILALGGINGVLQSVGSQSGAQLSD